MHVYVIDAWEGPRHDKARAIWRRWADITGLPVHLFPSAGSHADTLRAIWTEASGAGRLVITELDFLPYYGLVDWPVFTAQCPAETAEYCTRDPISWRLVPHGLPGAWFIRMDTKHLHDPTALDFSAGGPFNDPANLLGESLADCGQGLRLLPQRDCRPHHWGTKTKGAGEHLFFSRHWNGDGSERPGGLPLTDILQGVDRTLDGWHI